MEEQSREAETRAPILDGELHLLLGDLKDEASGYRRREAAWISILVHVAIVLALIFMPKWLPRSVLIVPVHEKESTVFLDTSKSPSVKPPKTNIISDQDRTAQSKTPTLKAPPPKFLDARTPGPPKPVSPPPQPPGAQAMQAPPGLFQGSQPAPASPPSQTAQLEAPRPKQNPFAISSAGSAVDRAIHAAASDRPGLHSSFGGGEMGSGIRPKVPVHGDMDILSDTRGVDFGPYMKRLHVTVEDHWFPLIPEIALPPMMKKGRVIIEFAIMKDGSIQGLQVVSSSGDTALDRAAYGALLNAEPLPRLPVEFTGPYLRIRAAFYYNPDRNELE